MVTLTAILFFSGLIGFLAGDEKLSGVTLMKPPSVAPFLNWTNVGSPSGVAVASKGVQVQPKTVE